MSKSSESLYWLDGDGIEQNDSFIKREILEYNLYYILIYTHNYYFRYNEI